MRIKILLEGRVQGVGCRPFIYRIAKSKGLCGFVCNTTEGVIIEVQGRRSDAEEFVGILENGSDVSGWPPLMEVSSLYCEDIAEVEGETGFVIRQSEYPGAILSQVTADSATCDECLAEMNDTENFRHRYPFINCTNCGPRYSIIENIPYDRCNTTMSLFAMCEKCSKQYTEPGDRRFHAQPVACEDCGPAVSLIDSNGKLIESGSDTAIRQTAQLLRDGKVAAIKGIGGFHLAVDALNEEAVKRLRQRKQRDRKPFAMMARDVQTIRKYSRVNEAEERLICSVEAPIVLLEKLENAEIAPSVADGVNSFGFMVCNSPLHHLLFAEEGIEVLVMTSANHSDEPLICKNDEALSKVADIADAFLMHDRDIRRQVDDSVVQVVSGRPALLRRSRGYVPRPILTKTAINKHIFAAGADLKNTFCLAKDHQYIISEHIGDLADGRVYRHYVESVKHLQKLFEVEPEVVVCDMHPSYISTQYAHGLAREIGAEIFEVQHHWAHIASVLAEYEYDGQVIGLVADGTGYGTDGSVWGCECLIASLGEFSRFGHLDYFALPGGDTATKEAVRPLMGLMSGIGGGDVVGEFEGVLKGVESDAGKLELVSTQIVKNINTVSTSSMGRLFDAVACLAGVGGYNRFDAELPMGLEAIAAKGCDEAYPVDFIENGETVLLDFRNLIRDVVRDVESSVCPGVISARFHNWAAAAMVGFAQRARKMFGLSTVALAGGVFCNKYLAGRTIELLQRDGFNVLYKRRVPANDGGISLGQAAIGAARMNIKFLKELPLRHEGTKVHEGINN